MRCIFVGIEYAGKTTLVNLLTDYYRHRKLMVHVDDHFTIPDSSLSEESRAAYVNFPDDVKERMQRMQLQYHIEVIRNYPNTMIAGWHIEELVYSSFYGDDPESPYYSKYHINAQRGYETQVIEARLPDVVMIHVDASDDIIAERMETAPHDYQIIKKTDIPEIKRLFQEEIDKSLFTHKGRKIVLDTTGKTPTESLDELLLLSESLVTFGELAVRAMDVPDTDYQVRYENGVRKIIPG